MSDKTIKIVLEISVVDGNVNVRATSLAPAPVESPKSTINQDAESLQSGTQETVTPTSDVVTSAESSKDSSVDFSFEVLEYDENAEVPSSPSLQDTQESSISDSESMQNGTSKVSSPKPAIVASAVSAQVVKIVNDIENMQKSEPVVNEQPKPTLEDVTKMRTDPKDVATHNALELRKSNPVEQTMLVQMLMAHQHQRTSQTRSKLTAAMDQVRTQQMPQKLVQEKQEAVSQPSQLEVKSERKKEELQKLANERLAQALDRVMPNNSDSSIHPQQQEQFRKEAKEEVRARFQRALQERKMAKEKTLTNAQKQSQQSLTAENAEEKENGKKEAVNETLSQDPEQDIPNIFTELSRLAQKVKLMKAQAQAQSHAKTWAATIIKDQVPQQTQQSSSTDNTRSSSSRLLNLLPQSQPVGVDQAVRDAHLDVQSAAMKTTDLNQQQKEERAELFRQRSERIKRDIAAFAAEVKEDVQFNAKKHQKD